MRALGTQLLKALTSMGVGEYEVEKQYGSEGKRCDLWFKTPGNREYYCELKTIPELRL